MGATPSCSISRQRRIAETTAYRLIHRPPELAVDRFADVAIIHANSFQTLMSWLPQVRAKYESVCPTGFAKIHTRRVTESTPATQPVWGPRREEVVVTEHGVRYLVRPSAGLSVGLFLDMREVRQWLLSVTRERSVLNLFAYTCSLGVCASISGASRVVNIDVSKPNLAWGKDNYALNGLSADPQDFIYGDAFDWLGRFARRVQQFDLVIVDPPSFSSTPFSVTRDYPRLVCAAARILSPGGVLLAATNHAQTSDRQFDRWLSVGISEGGRTGRAIGKWHEPADDFPVPAGGRPYLKARALQLD